MKKDNRLNQPHFYSCSIEAALDVIGDKWKGVILYHLMAGTKRFNELKRLAPAVTQRVLTRQLRELEQDRVIIRKVYPSVPPKVEYSLSELGQELRSILSGLEVWGNKVMQSLKDSSEKISE